MRNIVFRQRAQLDLESIYLHIAVALGSPKAAQDTVGSIYDALDGIAEMPTLGASFAHDDLEREYRRTLVKNYWIYYSFDDEQIVVWRIFHTRQDIATHTVVEF